jgi:hypothetical protein
MVAGKLSRMSIIDSETARVGRRWILIMHPFCLGTPPLAVAPAVSTTNQPGC